MSAECVTLKPQLVVESSGEPHTKKYTLLTHTDKKKKKQYLAAALIPFKTIGRGEQRAEADLLTPSAGYGKPSSSASVAAAPGTSSSSPASLSASD